MVPSQNTDRSNDQHRTMTRRPNVNERRECLYAQWKCTRYEQYAISST